MRTLMSFRTSPESLVPNAIRSLFTWAGYDVGRHPAGRRVQVLNGHRVDLVLDVGAAVGSYGTSLRRFGYRGAIASFEPMQRPYDALRLASRDDPLWTTHHLALGDHPGKQVINVAANSDSSSLLPMLDACSSAEPDAAYVGTESVRVERLDDLWPDAFPGCRAPFLKIDAQGFERQVLDGARSVVPRLAGVQIELSFRPLYEGGMLHIEAIGRLDDAGFTLVGVEPGFRNRATGELLQADAIFMRM